MRGLILAGGKGTRLRPLTVYTPKPAVPLVNRPFLLYQLENLKSAGIDDITLSLGYQPQKIEQLVGDGSDCGVRLTYLTEPHPMGTGGAYRYAAGSSGETAIVLNGDILTDFDIGRLIEFHRGTGSRATIALARVDDPTGYGMVETDADGQITCFMEKPDADAIAKCGAGQINAGIYLLEPEILRLIPLGENRSFEYHIFPEILKKGLPFYGFGIGKSYWRDIGNPASYLQANMDLLDGQVKAADLSRPAPAEVSQTASIDAVSVTAVDCVVKPHSKIIRSVIGTGVHIEEKVTIRDSVIWPHARISGGANIEGSVIGRGCYIGKNAVLRNGTVLGDKASVPDYSVI